MANIDIIKKRIETLEKNQKDVKDIKMILKEELECDDEYQSLMEQRKNITLQLKNIKENLEKRFSSQIDEMKNAKEEIDALKEILSAELFGLFEETKQKNIMISDGSLRTIVISSKAVKTNQRELDMEY